MELSDEQRQAFRDSLIPEHHVLHDYNDGAFFPAEEFDLVWSCEFVEHVEECYLPNFLATFEASRRYLMVTHAHPWERGHHHVNCQPAGYWVQKVEALGFRFDRARTVESRALVGPGHYRNRGLFFARS